MKKRFLIVTIAFALAATAVYAGESSINDQKLPVEKSVNSSKNVAKPVGKIQVLPVENPRMCIADKRNRDREFLYTALNLSEGQREKALVLDAKTRKDMASLMTAVKSEVKKLKALETNKASRFAIYKQKLALKSAKHELDNYIESSKKSFEAILTKEQRAKYKVIDNAKKKELERLKKGYKGSNHKILYGPKSVNPLPPSEIERPMNSSMPPACNK